MEPLLHFAVAFALAVLLGLRLRWALALGLVGILPDLDVLFFMHRSVSHSILPPLLLLLACPLAWRSSIPKVPLSAISLGWASHSFLDLIDDYTPVLFPLSSKSYRLVFESNIIIGSRPSISMSLVTLEKSYNYGAFTYLDAPLFTASGLAIGLIIIALALSVYYGGPRGVMEKLLLREDLRKKNANFEERSEQTSNRS